MASPDEIRTLERKAWDALCTSGSAFLPLLAEDSVMLFPGGMKLNGQSTPTLASTLTSDGFVPWSRYTISDVEVLPLDEGGAAAYIAYRVEAERESGGEQQQQQQPGEKKQTTVFKALCSSTWRRRMRGELAGGWEMVAHQQTPV